MIILLNEMVLFVESIFVDGLDLLFFFRILRRSRSIGHEDFMALCSILRLLGLDGRFKLSSVSE